MESHKLFFKCTILSVFLVLFGFIETKAQTFGSVTDELGNPVLERIAKTNGKMTATAVLNREFLKEVKDVISEEYLFLTKYNELYIGEGIKIQRFFKESYDFVEEKYPIVEPTSNVKYIGNPKAIRLRYGIMLGRESKKVNSYLAFDNYMSEGDRILLLLSSLEKVIKTCIKNEKF
ncbi:hypothetical protein SAMN05421766_1165 [Zobellia uliginosa]|uniref:Uncharacterized protein n=1 Tax=Zobellia uliginosa TaxID=143224 RepID=A0ABY1L296_9FLAO|nr:hypothetical protein [Zobellia uliginosa]SIT15639.1 hypothetical protein SAMN05421766_1165 [Zobellia uliginosa]